MDYVTCFSSLFFTFPDSLRCVSADFSPCKHILYYKPIKQQLIYVYQTRFRAEIKRFVMIDFIDLEQLRDRFLFEAWQADMRPGGLN